MATSNAGINKKRLFWGSCLSLITTAFAFSVTREIQTDIQTQFVLLNEQVGLFAGVFFWGFVISQVIFSPLCDTIGIRPIVRGAFIGHVGGALMMMFAPNFTFLWLGSLTAGIGAGLVEAGCNPLIVALYPDKKTEKLNIFHMWFPYGNVIAALLALGLAAMAVSWQMRLLLILIPAVAYGIMMFTAEYPETEGVSAGVSTSDMLKACFASPLMWLMLAMMLITASMELPASSWVPPVLESGDHNVPGILIFAYLFGIMGTLRLLAGPVEKKLKPTGILFYGAILATAGLFTFSYATTVPMLFLTATLWAVGIAYFWPTMLAYVSEQNPKSGALGLGMMGAVGMLAAGVVSPQMGGVIDNLGHGEINQDQARGIIEVVDENFGGLTVQGQDESTAVAQALELSSAVLANAGSGELPPGTTAQALRAIGNTVSLPEVAASDFAGDLEGIGPMLNAAQDVGGRAAFRRLSLIGIVLIVVFGGLWMRARMAGGYKAEKLTSESTTA